MSTSRKFRVLAVGLFTASLLVSAPLAQARPLEPGDPITRIIKIVKKLIHGVVNDDGMNPPHP